MKHLLNLLKSSLLLLPLISITSCVSQRHYNLQPPEVHTLTKVEGKWAIDVEGYVWVFVTKEEDLQGARDEICKKHVCVESVRGAFAIIDRTEKEIKK